MRRRSRWTALVAAAIVGLGVGVGIGAAVWTGGDHRGTAATEATGRAGSNTMASGDHEKSPALGDRQFIEQMTAHHRLAVQMALMALERAEHPEVVQLARGIVSAQRREIAQMAAWHRAWFGGEPAEAAGSSSDMKGMGLSMGMEDLQRAKPFDRAFLAAMIPHHAGAIVMSERLLAGSGRAPLRRLAMQIVAAQSQEVGQMQLWREAWYPPLG